jgi:phosphinothricin acetyltransferase
MQMKSPYRIRCAQTDDAEHIAAIYAPMVEDTVVSFEECAPSVPEMARRIGATTQTWPWLVAESDGSILGYAYASAHRTRAAYRWSVDVTVYVASAARRQGVGTALYAALFELLALQGYHRAYAGITLPNEASVALHRAVGFELVGVYAEVGFKLGAWRDVSWWERVIESGSDGAEPQPFPSLDPGLLVAALVVKSMKGGDA